MAILGTILITQNQLNIEDNLGKLGLPKAQADQIASDLSSGAPSSGGGGAQAAEIFKGIQISYAESTQTIFYIMTGVLVVLFFFALVFVPGGKVDKVAAEGSYDAPPSGS